MLVREATQSFWKNFRNPAEGAGGPYVSSAMEEECRRSEDWFKKGNLAWLFRSVHQ
jgi:hypothetical protein